MTSMPDARSAAKLLGGQARRGSEILCPGPGHSRFDRSLSVKLDPRAPDGFIVYSYAGDSPIECRDFVRHKLGLPGFAPGNRPETARPIARPMPTAPEPESVSTSIPALRLWREAYDARGTAAERYLEARVPGFPREIFETGDIRFHPAASFKSQIDGTYFRRPSLVALFRDIQTNEESGGILRIAIKPDGSGKADMPDGGSAKRALGPSRNGAIKLSPDDDVTIGLHIAEGVESALSVMTSGFRPTWATAGTATMQNFPILAGIESLTVFGDNDSKGGGQRAAQGCAERWRDAGKECRVFIPKTPGKDWNDVITQEHFNA